MKRKSVVRVDEPRCIGCARCLDACPVDAIVGAQGMMHTAVEPWCIGCDLCVPACPVDCIEITAPYAEWTQADQAAVRQRARARQQRMKRGEIVSHGPEARKAILAALLGGKRRA